MSRIEYNKPKGVLKKGWYSTIDDYAIAGGWSHNGQMLVVGDSAGGVYVFEGKTGKVTWKKQETHGAGLLAMAIHPRLDIFASAGQDGKLFV